MLSDLFNSGVFRRPGEHPRVYWKAFNPPKIVSRILNTFTNFTLAQGNESEALKSWRSALDQIYYHNAYRVPAGYKAKSETEKALQDSLRDMEMQCKERVDLLEALKQSRLESNNKDETSGSTSSKLSKSGSKTPRMSSDSDNTEKGFIGGGTIPAVNYPDLSRPPPLPTRPPMMSKNSSEQAVVGRIASSSSSRTITPLNSNLAPPIKKTSRSPSPEKGRSMLTTLRSGRGEKKPSSRSSTGPKVDRPEPSKAAALAWNSAGKTGRDRLGRSLDTNSSSTTIDSTRRASYERRGSYERASPTTQESHYDFKTRTMVEGPPISRAIDLLAENNELYKATGRNNDYPYPPTDPGQPGAVAGSMLRPSAVPDLIDLSEPTSSSDTDPSRRKQRDVPKSSNSPAPNKLEPLSYPTYLKEYPKTSVKNTNVDLPIRRRSPARPRAPGDSPKVPRKPMANSSSPRHRDRHMDRDEARRASRRASSRPTEEDNSSQSIDDDTNGSEDQVPKPRRKAQKQKEMPILADPTTPTSDDSDDAASKATKSEWEKKVAYLLKHLPKGVDEGAAKQIFNEIVVQGDEVHWEDVAGLEVAKNALKEAVVYPFLRPDLFMGLREPARGMLLFGPPGTGKTMLARAVATESRSTFFSISASSLTSKYLGESEKLVRALFSLAKALAPSIIFVDEIDSLLSSRSGSGEHEATRRIKTEFLIQWSDLQRAAAGREQTEKEKERGDASRVLVLAATNLPWAIDEAARRRFVRRQYIPLPEDDTRALQMRTLLGHQKHSLDERDIQKLVELTDGKFRSTVGPS